MTEIPKMYDVKIDEFRPVGQEDIDKFQMWSGATGALLDGQDVLRSLYRAVCSGRLELSSLQSAVREMRSYLPKSEALQYCKQFEDGSF